VSGGTFPTERYDRELRTASENRIVGSSLVTTTDDEVAIWTIRLQPGERLAFHHHAVPYAWICTSPGDGLVRSPDGTFVARRFELGDIRFVAPQDVPATHDLENCGDSILGFVTVELLG
jgi:hypothetical protein